MALQPAVQRRRPDVELLGGAGLVAFVQREHRDEVLLLDLVERAYGPAGGLRDVESLLDDVALVPAPER
jgi:hypothetical protein